MSRAAPGDGLATGGVFSTGVRAGTPTPRGITLMTAVDDLADDGRLLVEVARDPAFARVVVRRTIAAGARTAGVARARIVRVPLERRMQNGRQAFWESLPVEKARTQWPGLYRRVPLGAAADLFLLDLHSYADPPTAGTYLGARQLAWLQRELARSRATWKLVASSTCMMGTDIAVGVPLNLNQWDGYADERRALMEWILTQDIHGVVVLSGDLHTFIAGAVTTTGRGATARPRPSSSWAARSPRTASSTDSRRDPRATRRHARSSSRAAP